MDRNKFCILAPALIFIVGNFGCASLLSVIASQERWVGIYQAPFQKQVGVVIADLSKFAGSIKSDLVFKNETVGFEGKGKFAGEVRGQKVSMAGQVHDSIQGCTSVSMEGTMKNDVMEGTFTQQVGSLSASGRFVLVKLTHTTYLGSVRIHHTTQAGKQLIDLGVAYEGLLGPGRPDVYGPGIHADATGRPFSWRTDDGQMTFGRVKENAYGLGVGMDQFGRPVRAKPLW